jgi:8-oxo-dGTP pyrophosphatase MutT (NUDIX family)
MEIRCGHDLQILGDQVARPPPPEPKPSATILLVRDAPAGLEVFMVQRHHRVDFATGALVFPGGKVDPGDADPALAGCCEGAAGESMRRAVQVAAIRETFEECGVLLARPRGEAALVPAARLREIEARHREPLHRGETPLAAIAGAEDLLLACDLLLPFAHWITPEFMPRRFDTHFFLVAAPADQVAVHDGGESVDSMWIAPGEAVAAAEQGRHTIVFPTLMNLKKLGRSRNVAEALAAAQRAPIVTVLPELAHTDAGPVMRLPAEAGYDLVEAPLDAVR